MNHLLPKTKRTACGTLSNPQWRVVVEESTCQLSTIKIPSFQLLAFLFSLSLWEREQEHGHSRSHGNARTGKKPDDGKSRQRVIDTASDDVGLPYWSSPDHR